MSLTLTPGPVLGLSLVNNGQVVNLAVQTTPSFTMALAVGQGPSGTGLPSGGFTDQALVKLSNTDLDYTWVTLDKAKVGLGNVDNTSDVNKPVSTATATALDLKADITYVDSVVTGLWDDRGAFDASVNTYPTTGGSGTAGAVLKGDIWTISVVASSGPLVGQVVGTLVRALVDTPAQVGANWSITAAGLGYVPENVANKDASGGYAGLTLFKLNLRNAANTVTSWFTTAATAARTWTLPDKDGTLATTGAITSGEQTMSTARLLGRTTAATGAVEEITVGSGLTLTGGSLAASASATLTVDNKTASYSVVAGDNGKVIRTTSGAGNIILPSCAAVGVGFNFTYENVSGGEIAILRVGSDTFKTGETSLTVKNQQIYTFAVMDNSATGKWSIVAVAGTGAGANSVALGTASAGGTAAVAIGYTSNAIANYTVALGYGATVNSQYGVAVGGNASATANNSTAIGANTTAGSTNSTTIGSNSAGSGSVTSTGSGATALGGSYASGVDSFAAAIGNNTSSYGAQGANSVAMGIYAKTTGIRSFALGYNAVASGVSSYAISYGALASADYGTAIGANAASGGSQAVTGAGAMALGGSYASGTDSFAAAVGNNTSTYGAQGANSVAIGFQAKATGAASVALSTGNVGATATGQYGVALGNCAVSDLKGKLAYTAGRFSYSGDMQHGIYVLGISASAASTNYALTTDTNAAASSNQIVVPINSAVTFSGEVIARQKTTAGTNVCGWLVKGVARREATGNIVFVGTPAVDTLNTIANWTLTVVADTANQAVQLVFNMGAAGMNVNVVATIRTTELTYA